jgi:hypothetical protein
MTTINCYCPLSIEHFDHTSVEEFQSRQWPWVSFPNPPLLCRLMCARTPPPFLLFPRWRRWTRLMGLTQTSLSGSSWIFSWIQTTQPEVPSTPDSLLSSKMDAQRIGSSWWWPSVRLRTWCPWRNLRTRPGCFRLCWRVKPYLSLNIISWEDWRQKTQKYQIMNS